MMAISIYENVPIQLDIRDLDLLNLGRLVDPCDPVEAPRLLIIEGEIASGKTHLASLLLNFRFGSSYSEPFPTTARAMAARLTSVIRSEFGYLWFDCGGVVRGEAELLAFVTNRVYRYRHKDALVKVKNPALIVLSGNDIRCSGDLRRAAVCVRLRGNFFESRRSVG